MKTLTLLAVLASGIVSGQITYDCLYEMELSKIKLQVKKVNGNPISVKYKGQKESMSLQMVSEDTYNEIYQGKVNGKYEFIFLRYLGNVAYYTNYKTGKKFDFSYSSENKKSPCFK